MSTGSTISEIERWVGRKLPDSYSMLLFAGIETCLSPKVVLFAPRQVIENNKQLQTKEYCPDYLAIGVSNEGRAILISLTAGTCAIFLAGKSGLDPHQFTFVSSQLSVWAENGCKI